MRGVECGPQSIDEVAIGLQPALGAFQPFGEAAPLAAQQRLGFLGAADQRFGYGFQPLHFRCGAAEQRAALLQSGVEAGQGGRVGLIQLANARVERDQQCFRAADQLFGRGAAGAQRFVDPPRFGRQLLQRLRQSLIARQRRLFEVVLTLSCKPPCRLAISVRWPSTMSLI